MLEYSEINYKKAKKELSKISPVLKKLLQDYQVNFAPVLKRSPYESLIRAIAHQQLHGKAAETILARFVALYRPKKFPTPDDILRTSDEVLRACGFSNSKVKSIKDIALKTLDGTVPNRVKIKKLENEEIIKRLTVIFGVGKWTVEMLLIFQLGRLNVWPVDDFGVRKGFQLWKKKKEMLTAKELQVYQSHFSPYETVVALYMWAVADVAKKIKEEK